MATAGVSVHSLPCEILCMILGIELSGKDLKQIRYVSKAFRDAANPILLATIRLEAHPDSFDKLLSLAERSHLASYVRTIDYSPAWRLASHNRRSWNEAAVKRVNPLSQSPVLPNMELSQQEITCLEIEIWKYVEAQDTLLEDDREHRMLVRIFERLPYVISMRQRYSRDRVPRVLMNHCARLFEGIQPAIPENYTVVPRMWHWFWQSGDPRGFQALLHACQVTGKVANVRCIDGPSFYDFKVEEEYKDHEVWLSKMEHLCLTARHYTLANGPNAERAKRAFEAVNLKSFEIHGDDEDGKYPFPLFMWLGNNIRWSLLSRLTILEFLIDLPWFEMFLQAHMESLKFLEMGNIHFEDHSSQLRDPVPFLQLLHFLNQKMRLKEALFGGSFVSRIGTFWISKAENTKIPRQETLLGRMESYALRQSSYPTELADFEAKWADTQQKVIPQFLDPEQLIRFVI